MPRCRPRDRPVASASECRTVFIDDSTLAKVAAVGDRRAADRPNRRPQMVALPRPPRRWPMTASRFLNAPATCRRGDELPIMMKRRHHGHLVFAPGLVDLVCAVATATPHSSPAVRRIAIRHAHRHRDRRLRKASTIMMPMPIATRHGCAFMTSGGHLVGARSNPARTS